MALNNIKVERTRFGLSQEELAKAIGVNKSSIGNWENDIGGCSTSNLMSMCNIFGCSLDYLVGITEKRRRP
jgi:DNA-binding XRE family transcriptional regulator